MIPAIHQPCMAANSGAKADANTIKISTIKAIIYMLPMHAKIE